MVVGAGFALRVKPNRAGEGSDWRVGSGIVGNISYDSFDSQARRFINFISCSDSIIRSSAGDEFTVSDLHAACASEKDLKKSKLRALLKISQTLVFPKLCNTISRFVAFGNKSSLRGIL